MESAESVDGVFAPRDRRGDKVIVVNDDEGKSDENRRAAHTPAARQIHNPGAGQTRRRKLLRLCRF
jgi:hypothetical protein